MNWIEELKQTETEDQQSARIQAELKLLEDRTFRAKAPESWDGLVDQLKVDCAELTGRCSIIQGADGSLELVGNSSPIRCYSIQFILVGHYIRVIRTYSHDGITNLPDGVEKIRLKLQPDDSISFLTDLEEYRLVRQVSRYLITQVIRGRLTRS